MLKIKIGEFFVRTIELPFRCTDALVNEVSAIRFVEKGVLAPVADIVRVGAETSIYYEKRFLEMSPEERENESRPICDEDDTVVGHKPIDEKECEDNIEISKRNVRTASSVKISSELGVVSKVVAPLYERVALFLKEKYMDLIRKENIRLFHRIPERERHWLLDLPSIPAPFHNDIVFSNYIGLLSKEPIRYVVGDPNGRTLYEKSWILTALTHQSRSPATRGYLRSNLLVPKPAIQALINHRLSFHERKLNEYLNSSLTLRESLNAAVANQSLQASADQEHPTV